MQKTPTDYINAALDIIDHSLPGYIETRLQVRYGDEWFDYVQPYARFEGEEICWDTQAILKTMTNNWNEVFQSELGHVGRSLVGELWDWRNQVAHRSPQKPIDHDAAYRAVDTVWRLPYLVGLPQAQEVRAVKDELQAQNIPMPIQANELKPASQEQTPANAIPALATDLSEVAVVYEYKRFCFKASKIEPLQDDQVF
jgi:hypothetical protein